jgi:DNA-binding MarR family transcriptional regulator
MSEKPSASGAGQTQALAGELRVLAGKLKRRLREQTHLGDLTWPQVMVISQLDREGPTTVTTLAKAEGVRPQSMGATVSSLEEAGLVSGSPDPSDGRQTLLSLTPKCAEWLNAERAAREDWLFRTIQAKLTPAEQEEVAKALTLMNRLIDP